MALLYDGQRPNKIIYKNTSVNSIYYQNQLIWGTGTLALTGSPVASTIAPGDPFSTTGWSYNGPSNMGLWLTFKMPEFYVNIESLELKLVVNQFSCNPGVHSAGLYAITDKDANGSITDNEYTQDNIIQLSETPYMGTRTVTATENGLSVINSLKPVEIGYRFGVSPENGQVNCTIKLKSAILTINYTI